MYEKYNNDILYKIKSNIRSRVKIFLKSKNISKNNKTFDIVNCTPYFLKKYLEKHFKFNKPNKYTNETMSWNNYGYGKDKWNIDHIIPLSLSKTKEEAYKLCHYTNLQPMWQEENQSKSNNIL